MLTEYTHRFLSSEVPARPAEQCLFHVIPVPLEATVSYAGGTAQGPAGIPINWNFCWPMKARRENGASSRITLWIATLNPSL